VRIDPGELHHVVRPWSGEGEAQSWSERLLWLQELGRLAGLNQLLKLLELRWYELQKLLDISQLLLLEDLQLLQLLWHGVKKLQDLLQRLCITDRVSRLARERLTILLCKRRDAERLTRIWSKPPWDSRLGQVSRRGKSKRTSL
jgi:hypothetical protein